MAEITKYNSFDNSIQNGDIVVFLDGSRKTIKKVDGHKVVFEDDSKSDLWSIENLIEGIIHLDAVQSIPVATPFDYNKDGLKVKNTDSNFKSLATSYEELKKLMYHGGDKVEFYHITAIQNALAIFAGDYFYSREAGVGHIKYDNAKLNDITSSVMSSNYSYRLEKYARFYLNIKNKTTYSMYKNYGQHGSYGVIIAFDYPVIWKSKTKVILSPTNAHGLVDEDYNWSRYNIGYEPNIKNLDASRFDFKRTFSACDFKEDNPYLAAEILFYEKIDLSLVSHVYFKTTRERDYFLSKIPYNKKVALANKCVVKEELFW